MQENKEIKALLQLLEDPDEVVYHSVSDKIISFGKGIIPNLESYWENNTNSAVQERIELLIHGLHFKDLTASFDEWLAIGGDLISGSIIVSKYHYPDLNTNSIFQDIEKLRRNIWLELNNYLTPLEKIGVLNSIIYNYYRQTGVEYSYDHPDHFLINKTLETKTGNMVGNGIIYLILCNLLDISVKAVSIPNQFLLAYFDDQFDILQPTGHPSQKILFYIDPNSGQMYTHKDIENYLKKMSTTTSPSFYRPLSNQKTIKFLLEELSICFDNDNNRYKMEELISLANKIEE